MLLTDIFADNFFDDFLSSAYYRPNRIESIPAMKADVKELESCYKIDLELPGFKKENLRAELKDGYLIIKAVHEKEDAHKNEKCRYICQERYLGHYQRSFYVGEEITEEDIHASFENGVLKLEIPKKEAQRKVKESKSIMIEG